MRKIVLSAAVVGLLAACDGLERGSGELRLSFDEENYVMTKAAYSLPDTSDFILTVKDAAGKTLYDGPYGASPEGMLLGAGTYNIKVSSNSFSAPSFDCPQYGDEQTVKVSPGSKVLVRLVCTQVNCGVRLKTDPSFLDSYPSGLLYLKSPDGKLQYSYRETRIAYFNPGAVSLVLDNAGEEELLMTRTLAEQQILTVSVSAASTASSTPSSSVSVQVDTTRSWIDEKYVIGGSNPSRGDDPDNAFSTVTAKDNVGATGVWVLGYIVGGDMTSSAEGMKWQAPFTSRTHLAIGPRSSTSTKQSCLSVFLPTGKVRDALNLADHPENIGRHIYVRGDIVAAYYGIPGIKNVTDYRFR